MPFRGRSSHKRRSRPREDWDEMERGGRRAHFKERRPQNWMEYLEEAAEELEIEEELEASDSSDEEETSATP